MEVKIAPGWKKSLENEFKAAYFHDLVDFLKNEKLSKQTVYPPGPLIFNAFNQTDLNKVKVVIIGQDPYHGPNQAHGLSFSVQKDIPAPPSLVNIFKEIKRYFKLCTVIRNYSMRINYSNSVNIF
jgi:uracil-DNA glycosylase